MKVKLSVLLAAVVLLTACSLRRAEPDRIYVLRPAASAGAAAVTGVLAVPRPAVQPGLDTERIALVRAGNELDYYAASRWGDSLPRVLGAFAVEALAGSGGFTTVLAADRMAVASDYELLVTVRHFEAHYESAAPVVQVALECALVAGAPRRVLGRCDAAASEVAEANRMGAIVAAFEVATRRAFEEARSKAVTVAAAR